MEHYRKALRCLGNMPDKQRKCLLQECLPIVADREIRRLALRVKREIRGLHRDHNFHLTDLEILAAVGWLMICRNGENQTDEATE